MYLLLEPCVCLPQATCCSALSFDRLSLSLQPLRSRRPLQMAFAWLGGWCWRRSGEEEERGDDRRGARDGLQSDGSCSVPFTRCLLLHLSGELTKVPQSCRNPDAGNTALPAPSALSFSLYKRSSRSSFQPDFTIQQVTVKDKNILSRE